MQKYIKITDDRTVKASQILAWENEMCEELSLPVEALIK